MPVTCRQLTLHNPGRVIARVCSPCSFTNIDDMASIVCAELDCDSYDGSRSDATPIPTAVRPHPHPLSCEPGHEPGYIDRVHRWFAGQVDVTALIISRQASGESSSSESDGWDSETSSTCTIKDHLDSKVWEGGWLTGNPEEAQAHIYVH
jgi:hypothetical protein